MCLLKAHQQIVMFVGCWFFKTVLVVDMQNSAGRGPKVETLHNPANRCNYLVQTRQTICLDSGCIAFIIVFHIWSQGWRLLFLVCGDDGSCWDFWPNCPIFILGNKSCCHSQRHFSPTCAFAVCQWHLTMGFQMSYWMLMVT